MFQYLLFEHFLFGLFVLMLSSTQNSKKVAHWLYFWTVKWRTYDIFEPLNKSRAVLVHYFYLIRWLTRKSSIFLFWFSNINISSKCLDRRFHSSELVHNGCFILFTNRRKRRLDDEKLTILYTDIRIKYIF